MEPSIFVAQGKPHAGRIETLRITRPDELVLTSKTSSDAKTWKGHGGRIHIDRDDHLTALLTGIHAGSKSIGESFDVRTGLQAYEKGNPAAA